MHTKHQSGKGAVGCLLAILAVAAVVVIAYGAIPKRIAVAELQDYCEKQAELASLAEFTDENIAKNIVAKAKELKLALNSEALHVRRDGGQVYIDMAYTVPLDFMVYTYQWKVDHKIQRVLF